jgi:hypothetical protein
MVIWRTCLILLPHLVLSQARRNLTSNLLEKLTWFVQQPLTDALNLAYLVPSAQVAAAVAFFGLVGLLLYFGGSLQNRLLQLALAVALIPLTYLPNLVAAENWGTYRTKSALTVLIAVYVLFALAGYLAKLPESFRHPLLISILGALAPVCLFLASTQVRDYFVVPQQLELKFVREHVASHFDKIDAIKRKYLNPRNEGLAPLTRYDEFGILSVLQYQAKKPMLLLLLREANQQRVAVKTSKTLQ